jgi:hypothetical protein
VRVSIDSRHELCLKGLCQLHSGGVVRQFQRLEFNDRIFEPPLYAALGNNEWYILAERPLSASLLASTLADHFRQSPRDQHRARQRGSSSTIDQ